MSRKDVNAAMLLLGMISFQQKDIRASHLLLGHSNNLNDWCI